MKCHALVGVETMVVMAVEFSGTYGKGTHDVNFIKPLVEKAIRDFPLQFLLADEAYLSEEMPEWLAARGLKAVIPIKKKWFKDEAGAYNEALSHLVAWIVSRRVVYEPRLGEVGNQLVMTAESLAV